MSQEIVLQPGESVTITAAPPPDPEPEPPQWDRIVPAGSHGDFTFATDGERVMFVPGAIVKGTIRISAKNVVLHGFTTTSETARETPVIILPGSSGILEDFHIRHVGTPKNGIGYSSISANDGNKGTGTSGPWTFRRFTQDQGVYGWYGTEVWGVRELVVEDGTFKGKGVPVSGKGGENGHMSLPRCDGFIVRRCTFDMTQGCWRVIEIVEENDWQFIDNTVLGQNNTRGDTCPLALGSTKKMSRGTIARNRVRDIKLFVDLIGDGHRVTDNRLTNVAVPKQGTASNVTWERNGPHDGPEW